MAERMNIHKTPINELISPEWNPRQITEEELQKLKTSLNEFGYIEPIIVNDVNNHIVGGNQRLKALEALGYNEVDVVYVHIEDINREKACNIALNKISGEWDKNKLIKTLKEIELSPININLTGFDDLELTELQIHKNETEITEDNHQPTDTDEIQTDIQQGDLFQLGNHRLYCGDATKKEDIETLIGGGQKMIDITFTSPPYNVGTSPTYEQTKLKKTSKYDNNNDNKTNDEYTQFLTTFTKNALEHSQYVFVNIQSLANNKTSIIEYMHNLKQKYADTIIWDKKQAIPQYPPNVLNTQFEYIHIFSQKGNRHIGTIPFKATIPNIIQISREHNEYSKHHNAIFPIKLPTEIITKFAKNTVLDLFGGTGTTLIASEQNNKKSYTMELEPKYCQIIINRWQQLTGEKAIKIN